jgi:hypothetical protein
MGAGNVHRPFKLALVLAICCLIFVPSPQAKADTMTMCITDVSPTSNANCNMGDSVLLSILLQMRALERSLEEPRSPPSSVLNHTV